MGDPYMLFGATSFFFLWTLSVAGGIGVLLSWIYVEPEFEEGVLTRGSRCLVRARALLTLGCMVFWICTFLGQALTDSKDGLFGFWQKHPVLLPTLLFFADIPLIVSIVFAFQGRGSGRWVLSIATPIIAVACVAASIALSLP
jgi:hypothetical protein